MGKNAYGKRFKPRTFIVNVKKIDEIAKRRGLYNRSAVVREAVLKYYDAVFDGRVGRIDVDGDFVRMSLSLDDETLGKIDELVDELGSNRSEVVRMAVEYYDGLGR